MYINANGKTKGTYTDATDLYKLGTNKLLTFFRDDMSTGGEQSKGAVAMIQISNYAIDSTTIKNNYTLLSHTLDVAGASFNNNEVIISPNPANGMLHIALVTDCSYSICDITGRIVKTGAMQPGSNNIAVDYLPKGQYLLKIANSNGAKYGIYVFSSR